MIPALDFNLEVELLFFFSSIIIVVFETVHMHVWMSEKGAKEEREF